MGTGCFGFVPFVPMNVKERIRGRMRGRLWKRSIILGLPVPGAILLPHRSCCMPRRGVSLHARCPASDTVEGNAGSWVTPRETLA